MSTFGRLLVPVSYSLLSLILKKTHKFSGIWEERGDTYSMWNHSFKYTKFYKKLNFLTHYTHTYVCVSGGKKS